MDYRTKAINCVKDTVLPVQMQWFQDCGFNMDTYCQKYGDTEHSFAKESKRAIFMKWVIPNADVRKQGREEKTLPSVNAPDRV